MGDDDILMVGEMFARLDLIGTSGKMAVAQFVLGNDSLMTIRAGGPGTHSWPSSPPYERYEVLVSDKPPKFWTRFADSGDQGAMFDLVPRLLIYHHISRSGGMSDLCFESHRVRRTGMLELRLSVPEECEDEVMTAINAIEHSYLVKSRYVLSQ